MRGSPMVPRRRETDLLVRVMSDEPVVYDLKRDQAHCLNRTAAAIWQHCNGRTSVADVAAIVRRELNIAADDHVVWLALRQLQQARLLKTRVDPPSYASRVSRRELIRRL